MALQCCAGTSVSGTPGSGIDGELRRLDFVISMDRRGMARVDASLTNGFPMIVVGMGTVFCALIALVGLIALTTRILSRSRPETNAPSEVDPAALSKADGSGVEREASEDDLLRVALAAFSYHRRRRVIATTRAASSAWASAGRMRQIAPFRR